MAHRSPGMPSVTSFDGCDFDDGNFSDVDVKIAVRTSTAPTSAESILFPAVHSSVLSAQSLDSSFKPPYEIAIGNMKSLRYVAEWCMLRDRRTRAEFRDKCLVRDSTKGDDVSLLSVLAVAHELGAKEVFSDCCTLFQQRFRALEMSWPPQMAHLDMYGEKIHKAFLGAYRRPPLHEPERKQMDLFFFGHNVIGDITHSVAPQMVEGKVNEVEWKQLLESLDPFRRPVWQPDAESSVCPDCNQTFTKMWYPPVLASHCRFCGKKKCRNCTRFQADSRLAPLAKSEDGLMAKACAECYRKAEMLQKYAFLSHVFAFSKLNVLEISMMQLVSSEWRLASQLCLNEYREVFYRPLTQIGGGVVPISPLVRTIITSSTELFAGHCPAVVAVFSVLDWSKAEPSQRGLDLLNRTVDILQQQQGGSSKKKKRGPAGGALEYTHWHLLCARNCSMTKPEFFGLQLLQLLNAASASSEAAAHCRHIAGQLIFDSQANVDLMQVVVPLLLDLLQENPRQETRDLITRVVGSDKTLLMMVYRELCVRERIPKLSSLPQSFQFRMMKTDVEKSPAFNSDELHRVSAFLLVLEEMKSIDNADRVMHRELYNRLYSFELIPTSSTLFSSGGSSGDQSTAGDGGSGSPPPRQQAPSPSPASLTVLPEFVPLRPMPFLFDPTVTITGLHLKGVSIKSSAQRPMLLPLMADDGTTYPILFKKEDLRKDYVVCNIISLMEQLLLQQDTKLRPIPKYRVLPTTEASGIIEIVKNAKTVEVLREWRSTPSTSPQRPSADLQPLNVTGSFSTPSTTSSATPTPSVGYTNSSFGSHNPSLAEKAPQQSKPVETYLHSLPQTQELRENFLDSAAFYTVLTYMLGIADRHRGNVMVMDTGAILHIDFGFIIEEKPTTERFTSRYVRFDDDLQSCIKALYPDRTISQRLPKFLEKSADLLIKVRPFTDIITMCLLHLVTHNAVPASAESLCGFMRERLMTGKPDDEAKKEFVRRVEASFGDPRMQDMVHDAAQSIQKRGVLAVLLEFSGIQE